MKKLIIVLLVLLCTGCYDYNELNDLEIVSAMVVDYEEGEYVVNIEVLDTSDAADKGSYFLKGKGKTLSEAMNDVYFGSSSTPFYSHMKTLIVSDTVAKNGIEDFLDFLLRDTRIRKDFYMFVCEDVDEILDYETEPKESIGELSRMSAKRNQEGNGRFTTSVFREVIFDYLRDNYYMLGTIGIENETIMLEDTYVFIDNKMAFKIDQNAVLFANILNELNTKFRVYGDYTFEIYGYKLGMDVSKDKITLNLKGQVRLLEASADSSLNEIALKEIESNLNKLLEQTGMEIIDYAKRLNHDIFNFNYYYYLHYPRLVEDDTWKTVEYDFHSDVSISEKGLLLNTLEGSRNGE